MATQSHPIIDQQLQHNIHPCRLSVGDVLGGPAVPLTVAVHAVVVARAVRARVAGLAKLTFVLHVVGASVRHPRPPTESRQRLHPSQEVDRLLNGSRSLFSLEAVPAGHPEHLVLIEVLQPILQHRNQVGRLGPQPVCHLENGPFQL